MTNFVTNAGSGGSTFASDTISTVEYPLAKSAWGAAGAVNQTSVASPLPVQTITAAAVNTTGAITTAATTVGPVTMGSYVSVTVVVSGTYAGVNFGFWASNDNTVYWPVNAVRADTSLAETTTGVLTANQTRAWDVDMGGAAFFKVISTAFTSGSAAISILQAYEEGAPSVAAIAQGPAAAGTAIAGNPVLMGGSDATNVRALLLDTTGRQLVTLSTATAAMTMKAASTAAAAADTAVVVALSPNNSVASNLAVTVTAAANTAATLTIPAAGAGLFHYIDRLEIVRTATAALAGTATLVVTTTNLPGTLAWSFGNAMAAGGTQLDLQASFIVPLKSSAANTATTIVMPAPGAAVLWRANVFYHTGI
jgi:hypothetical protein